MLQTSPVHTGRTSDPAAALERLLDTMVRHTAGGELTELRLAVDLERTASSNLKSVPPFSAVRVLKPVLPLTAATVEGRPAGLRKARDRPAAAGGPAPFSLPVVNTKPS